MYEDVGTWCVLFPPPPGSCSWCGCPEEEGTRRTGGPPPPPPWYCCELGSARRTHDDAPPEPGPIRFRGGREDATEVPADPAVVEVLPILSTDLTFCCPFIIAAICGSVGKAPVPFIIAAICGSVGKAVRVLVLANPRVACDARVLPKQLFDEPVDRAEQLFDEEPLLTPSKTFLLSPTTLELLVLVPPITRGPPPAPPARTNC